MTRELCRKIGISEDHIQQKVEETLRAAESQGLDIRNAPLFVGFDMNGPLTRTDDAALRPYPHARECISQLFSLKKVAAAIVTGWDAGTVSGSFLQELNLNQLGLIAEHGMVFISNGKLNHAAPFRESDILKYAQAVLETAAEMKVPVAFQPNLSSGVQCVYVDGDPKDHGNLLEHALRRKFLNTGAREVWIAAKKAGFDGNYNKTSDEIRFEPSKKNLMSLYNALARTYPLLSFVVRKAGKDLFLKISRTNEPVCGEAELKRFAEELEKRLERRCEVNKDWCVDVWAKGERFERVNKESTTRLFAEKQLKTKNFVMTNVGDRPGDVFSGSNSLFFAMQGTKAEEHAKSNLKNFVIVKDGRDYALILAEIRRMGGP